MNTKNNFEERAAGAPKEVRTWLQVGSWLIAIVLSFHLSPPTYTLATNIGTNWIEVSRYAIAFISGALTLVAILYGRSGNISRWLASSVSLFVLFIISLIGYEHLIDSWTCPYEDTNLLIGSEYTAEATHYVERLVANGASHSCNDLLSAFSSDVRNVWQFDTVLHRYLILIAIWLITVLLFSTAILSLVHTSRIFTLTKKTPNVKNKKKMAKEKT
jgi:hypothetical protein